MAERKPLSKKLRFEVFKRDSFTCQYCGAQAPDVLLHVDHIVPVSKGGGDEILNLITACEPCNQGKSDRSLDDHSVMKRQRTQLDQLAERREQLEMMLEWRDALESEKTDIVEEVSQRIAERGGFTPNESGKNDIRRWLKQYSLAEILTALDDAFDSYMKWDGDEPNAEAWNVAFRKIVNLASINRQSQEKPYLRRLFYVQGILRKRSRSPRMNCIQALTSFAEDGLPVEVMEQIAKDVSGWEEFDKRADAALQAMESRDG